MIAAFFLLLAQDVPAPAAGAPAMLPDPEAEGEEIVVSATYGTTTMLFDKGADGRLRNCRIMKSSGSQRRDTNACQETPICYEKTRDEVTDCVELTAVTPQKSFAKAFKPAVTAPATFDLPKLVTPKPTPAPGTMGPIDKIDAEESDRQRVKKLPPVPREPSNGPAIRITNAQDK